ncbi:MAG TPA: hypothetical protein VGX03_12875 [Candidatus Binatia bacterium]|jgi:hypothetical protein|nr:hypothetical protein [Candidatus Binatia bacterium]
MNFNPLTRTCTEIQKQIDGLQQSEKQGADELQWYSSVDPHALTEDLRRNEAKAEKLQLDIHALEKEIHENDTRLGEIAPAIGTLLNPFNWFAKDQVDLRQRHAQLRETGEQKAAQKQSKVKELEDARARIAKVTSDLQRHGSFDLPRRQSDLFKIKQSIANKKEELELVAERKRRVDEVLAPLIQEMQNLESRKRRAESDLEAAQDFDRRLSSAGNSYERALIHEQCERKFGEGSPRRIVVEQQKEIRQIERDYDKAKRRAEDIGRKAGRKIDTIVIDGNNLCYEGGTFIGLSAIETLVPLLSRIYSVIVVFDSAIRRLLNTDDSGIQKRLGSHAKVHIVASRRLADETVLDLASANELTYVLSNDRFGDFNEKSVVKDGRLIRHEIVNGNVFVHDLQLRAAYC